MEDAVVGDAATATRGGARPGSASLALRPLGYLLIGLVWLALWAAVVALAWGIPVWGLIDGTLTVAEFTEPATSSVGGFLALVLLVAPIMVIIGGPVLLWWLPNCTWPLAALSFLYVIRSLNPAYRGESSRSRRRAPGAARSDLPRCRRWPSRSSRCARPSWPGSSCASTRPGGSSTAGASS
ncbi:hypothetical protein [Promicromonospora soli]